jgi:PIN domain nuclease of toxin-antitoxin system
MTRTSKRFRVKAVLTHEIMMVARQLSLHQDPSDRMIVATALVWDLTLVTADTRLLGPVNIKALANR